MIITKLTKKTLKTNLYWPGKPVWYGMVWYVTGM